jgi:fused signal recognition particle receptor
MGMFDLLRGKLRKFSKDVEEEVAKELPAEPKAKPAPARPAKPPASAPPEQEFDDDLERELAEIEAEVEAERRGEPAKPVAEPPRKAPAAARAGPVPRLEPPPRGAAPPPPGPAPPKGEAKPPPRAAPSPPTAKPRPAAAPAAPAKRGAGIRPERVEELLWDLELMLLEADIAVPVVEAIKDHLQGSLPSLAIGSTADVQPAVEEALKDALRSVLGGQVMDFDDAVLNAKKPFKIMFVGVNGTGKTTTIARIAHRLKQNGYSSVLAAGDTFRAGAIEQIALHSDRLGLTVVKHSAGADPAAVAHDAIQHALSRRKDVVLIDTAGRMQTNLNLMAEMKKIQRVAQPDLVVFVGDALAGNDAVEQARKFDEAVGIHAAILTKVDTDSKGGAALSIAHAVGKPILFLGVGQDYDDLIPFDPEWVIARIFGE